MTRPAIAFLTLAATGAAAGAPRPHVVHIVADGPGPHPTHTRPRTPAGRPQPLSEPPRADYGWNDVGYHNKAMRTPHIDALAAEGVILNKH